MKTRKYLLMMALAVISTFTIVGCDNDDEMHTVTASDGSFDSGDLDPDETFTHSFSEGGTFAYICKHHSGMTGTIIVVAD
jgi:plastocyanin